LETKDESTIIFSFQVSLYLMYTCVNNASTTQQFMKQPKAIT